MKAPEGLRLLADWFDARDLIDPLHAVPSDEVQNDLRKWAHQFEDMKAEMRRLEINQSYTDYPERY